MQTSNLLDVRNVTKYFPHKEGVVQAIDGVSFSIRKGEVLGLVGESGCGKSTLGKLIMRFDRCSSGEIFFNHIPVHSLPNKELKRLRRDMQIVFQDPYASLNPRMTVADIVAEPLDIHHLYQDEARYPRVDQLLNLVGLDSSYKNRFPHELSGGQRQRIGIARALALDPKFLVCDEPVSALDVSVQAQIINLLKKLQTETQLTFLFIAHDLSIVKYLSTRVAVMYLGKIVEIAPSEELYNHPKHPYTQALLSAIPIPDPILERNRKKTILQGEPPNPLHPPKGCVFSLRCDKATALCYQQRPTLIQISQEHEVACHYVSPP
ncbi:MAG: ATP-binding cassette domain-containing protein [Chlamydiae bacterium]|nr:ATP-binding cassette domain-containing protein [Chlamydiota bacterium]